MPYERTFLTLAIIQTHEHDGNMVFSEHRLEVRVLVVGWGAMRVSIDVDSHVVSG